MLSSFKTKIAINVYSGCDQVNFAPTPLPTKEDEFINIQFTNIIMGRNRKLIVSSWQLFQYGTHTPQLVGA